MRLIQILMMLRHRVTALTAALTPKSAWGRMLYTSAVVLALNDVVDRTFAFLFPGLSAVIGETIRRALPSAFVAGSLFLAAIAAVLAVVMAADGVRRAKRQGLSPPGRQDVIRLILILLAAAGIGLIDARLSATATHRAEVSDR